MRKNGNKLIVSIILKNNFVPVIFFHFLILPTIVKFLFHLTDIEKALIPGKI